MNNASEINDVAEARPVSWGQRFALTPLLVALIVGIGLHRGSRPVMQFSIEDAERLVQLAEFQGSQLAIVRYHGERSKVSRVSYELWDPQTRAKVGSWDLLNITPGDKVGEATRVGPWLLLGVNEETHCVRLPNPLGTGALSTDTSPRQPDLKLPTLVNHHRFIGSTTDGELLLVCPQSVAKPVLLANGQRMSALKMGRTRIQLWDTRAGQAVFTAERIVNALLLPDGRLAYSVDNGDLAQRRKFIPPQPADVSYHVAQRGFDGAWSSTLLDPRQDKLLTDWLFYTWPPLTRQIRLDQEGWYFAINKHGRVSLALITSPVGISVEQILANAALVEEVARGESPQIGQVISGSQGQQVLLSFSRPLNPFQKLLVYLGQGRINVQQTHVVMLFDSKFQPLGVPLNNAAHVSVSEDGHWLANHHWGNHVDIHPLPLSRPWLRNLLLACGSGAACLFWQRSRSRRNRQRATDIGPS